MDKKRGKKNYTLKGSTNDIEYAPRKYIARYISLSMSRAPNNYINNLSFLVTELENIVWFYVPNWKYSAVKLDLLKPGLFIFGTPTVS